MQAIILAGGLGTRLGDLTQRCPKPMLPVGGRPFAEYIVQCLARSGVPRILFSLSYLPETFRSHFGDGAKWGVAIEYVVEPEPLGTGGALRYAANLLEDEFLALNGDTFLAVDYLAIAAHGRAHDVDACVALRQVDDAGRYGSVSLERGRITAFREKNTAVRPGLINAGVYWMRRPLLADVPAGKCSIEQDVFPRLASKGRLGGIEVGGNFIDIGIPASLAAAQRLVPEWQRHATAVTR